MTTSPIPTSSNARRGWYDLTGGEWVLCAALVVLIAGIIGFAAMRWRADDMATDALAGVSVSTQAVGPYNGFSLDPCLIPRDEIRSGGPPKDGIPALTDPTVLPADQAGGFRDNDRMIGVAVDGQARAYPLSILNWHECVNDSLGGRPIAVTYCPLCDSAAVFDRRVGGQTREFGISGLLYNSNVLLHDRQPDAASESLWSQLQMRAVAGPAADEELTLEPVPCDLTTWGEWRQRFPDSTVVSRQTGHPRDYDRNPYTAYFASDDLFFAVNPAPSPEFGLRNKDRLVVVTDGREHRAYPLKAIAARAGATGVFEDEWDDKSIRILYNRDSDEVRVEGVGPDAERPAVLYTFWFAWHAMHPDGMVYTVPESLPLK